VVGVARDKELKLEDGKASPTLSEAGEGCTEEKRSGEEARGF
jgi:hypothetical protein